VELNFIEPNQPIAAHPMKKLLAAVVGASLLGAATLSMAQAWPDRPIKLVVPFPPGGSTDAVARTVAQGLSERLGQSVVIENKPGAGGSIGANSVAQSKPDGYTIGIATSSTHPAAVVLQDNLPYDPLKSFAPITQIGSTAFVLLASNELPAKNLGELVAHAKSHPDQVAFANVGTSTLGYLLTLQLEKLTGAKFNHITYKGSGQAYPDLMAGRVSLLFDNPGTSTAFVNSGKLKTYGVTIPTPSVPSAALIREAGSAQGLAKFDTAFWYGLVAPAGMPEAIVDRIQTEVARYIESDAGKAAFASMSLQAVASKPAAFAATIAADIKTYQSMAADIPLKK
jgi:tripartite-type tricarboxylate transporter receptor subunit TctC